MRKVNRDRRFFVKNFPVFSKKEKKTWNEPRNDLTNFTKYDILLPASYSKRKDRKEHRIDEKIFVFVFNRLYADPHLDRMHRHRLH